MGLRFKEGMVASVGVTLWVSVKEAQNTLKPAIQQTPSACSLPDISLMRPVLWLVVSILFQALAGFVLFFCFFYNANHRS